MASAARLSSMIVLVFTLVACAPAVEEPDPGSRHAELARSGYEAFAAGDMDAVYALMDPESVWYEMETLPYGGIYHGPDAVFENVFTRLGEEWEPYSATPIEFIAEGDRVAVRGEYRGTHRETGGQLVAPFAHFWRFENELLVEFHQITDTGLWQVAMAAE